MSATLCFELAPARAARIAAPICSMLRSIARTPADAVTTTVPLAESLDEFFRFLKTSSRAPHIHHETAVAPARALNWTEKEPNLNPPVGPRRGRDMDERVHKIRPGYYRIP